MGRLEKSVDRLEINLDILLAEFRKQFPGEFVSAKNFSFSNPSFDTRGHSLVCDIKFDGKIFYFVSNAPRKFMTETELDNYIEKTTASRNTQKIGDRVSSIIG